MRYPRLIWITGASAPCGHIPLVVLRETEDAWIGFNVEERRSEPASQWLKPIWKEVIDDKEKENERNRSH